VPFSNLRFVTINNFFVIQFVKYPIFPSPFWECHMHSVQLIKYSEEIIIHTEYSTSEPGS
jgi:hypothetical protein